MNELDKNEFLNEKLRAIERMQELNRRSVFNDTPHKMPPSPPFVRVNGGNQPETYRNTHVAAPPKTSVPKHERNEPPRSTYRKRSVPLFAAKNSDFRLLNGLFPDGDVTLILGIILLLSSENTDRTLLLALLYILL